MPKLPNDLVTVIKDMTEMNRMESTGVVRLGPFAGRP